MGNKRNLRFDESDNSKEHGRSGNIIIPTSTFDNNSRRGEVSPKKALNSPTENLKDVLRMKKKRSHEKKGIKLLKGRSSKK